jgi:hypothetical protein
MSINVRRQYTETTAFRILHYMRLYLIISLLSWKVVLSYYYSSIVYLITLSPTKFM